MRYVFIIFIFLFASIASAQQQDLTREQKIQELGALGGKRGVLQKQIEEIETRQDELEQEILDVADADRAEAERENAAVFRIFPRGLLDDKISMRGGAAYYSFTANSNDYNESPQIELQNGDLSVGFYGANFGFIADLQSADFSKINEAAKEVAFLIDYRPPAKETDAREEYKKSQLGFETGGVNYRKQAAAIVGHSYILRAVSYGEADALVVFKIHRKDADGSLIIFWKEIKTFAAPQLEAKKTVKTDAAETIDYEIAAAVRDALTRAGLSGVSVEATNKHVTLRGTVPKGKLADAVLTAVETGKRPVRNELHEQ